MWPGTMSAFPQSPGPSMRGVIIDYLRRAVVLGELKENVPCVSSHSSPLLTFETYMESLSCRKLFGLPPGTLFVALMSGIHESCQNWRLAVT